jgi:hypothetical protein
MVRSIYKLHQNIEDLHFTSNIQFYLGEARGELKRGTLNWGFNPKLKTTTQTQITQLIADLEELQNFINSTSE